MADRVTLSIAGFVDGDPGEASFSGRIGYDPALAPVRTTSNTAVYEIEDPGAVFEIDGVAQAGVEVEITVVDNLNVQGAGILFVDLLRLEFTGEGDWSYTVELVTDDLDTFRGTALPAGPLDIEDIGESTFVNDLVAPGIAPGAVDAIPTSFTLGQGPEVPLTTSEARAVARLYEVGLDRDGVFDLAGLNYWIDAREGRLDGQAVPLSERDLAAQFLGSPEFAREIGPPDSFTDEGLVDALYLNALGREADGEGRAFWIAALDDPGFGREDLLLAFSESVEKAEQLAVVETLVETGPGTWDFVG